MPTPMLSSVIISASVMIEDGVRTKDSRFVTALLDFFLVRSKKIFLLEQPMPGSDDLDIRLTIYENGAVVRENRYNFLIVKPRRRLAREKIYFSLKLRDIWSNIYLARLLRSELKGECADLCVGLESMNALCGNLFRAMKLVSKTVYYVFDWVPNRFKNPVLNQIYLFLDQRATVACDATWSISFAVADVRRDILSDMEEKISPQIYISYGIDFKPERLAGEEQVDSDLLVYSGRLTCEEGALMLLEAFNLIAADFPKARVLIVGGRDREQDIRNFIEFHDLSERVRLTGFVMDNDQIMQWQAQGAIGIAPYPRLSGARQSMGDVIKMHGYFASGLVVVTTDVSPVSREIREENLGLVSEYPTAESLAKEIRYLLSNKDELFQMRRNVIERAKKGSWENNYAQALSTMGYGVEKV